MRVDVGSLLDGAAQLTVLVAAAGAALLWFKRWLRKQVAEPLANMQTNVETVQAEFYPNRGHSMKDAITRIESKLDAHERRYEDHLTLGHKAGLGG